MTTPIEKIPEQIWPPSWNCCGRRTAPSGWTAICGFIRPPSRCPSVQKEPGVQFWFGPGDIEAAVQQILTHYNHGHLPNSPLLLNPIVHEKNADGSYTPIGSGIIWSTSACASASMC